MSFDDKTLAKLLRALAHDCENTDGWEGAAPDLHAAADRLLVLNLRVSDVTEWASNSSARDRDGADEWDRGWVAGYATAAEMASTILNRDGYDIEDALAGESA